MSDKNVNEAIQRADATIAMLNKQNSTLIDLVRELSIAAPDTGRYYLELKDKAQSYLKSIGE